MAPIRRYLRITKYSVLECRIYLDNPALAQSWLLHPRDPVLPRVIESVRPLVLPKLLEEKERARKKSSKKKGAIKDVLVEDDFEVALFLTETETRHSMLYKHRRARDKTQTKLVSNSTRLTGDAQDAPIDVDAADMDSMRMELEGETQDKGKDDEEEGDIVLTAASVNRSTAPAARVTEEISNVLLQEDSDEDAAAPLDAIPDIREAEGETARPKRRRQQAVQFIEDSEDDEADEGGDDESLFGSTGAAGSDDDDDEEDTNQPPAKRRRQRAATLEMTGGNNDGDAPPNKKKLVMDISYEGFAIYGRVLCLVVKQRGPAAERTRQRQLAAATPTTTAAATSEPTIGQATMENWIASTQVPPGMEDDDGA